MKTVVHVITSLNDGGAEAVLFRLCTSDRKCRHHVVSLVDAGKYGPRLVELGIPVTCLNMPRGRVTFYGLLVLWRTLREIKPDAVQTWMYHADLLGGVIAKFSGIRNVFWGIRHSTLIVGENARITIVVARICALLSRLVPKGIVCCAEKAREVHAALGYESSRMIVIPNGYDLAVFARDAASGLAFRLECGLPVQSPLIGFVARFNPEKDHANLLEALSLLEKRHACPNCLLVGTNMDEHNEKLIRLIERLGLQQQVFLRGRRDDIPSLMNALDVHVMSSSSEGFPNVIAEAMACGVPCVATDVGDAAEIVGGTGWIVPPRNPEALANAIEQALRERKRPGWESRCDDARLRVEMHFSIDRMVEDYHFAWFGAAGC